MGLMIREGRCYGFASRSLVIDGLDCKVDRLQGQRRCVICIAS